MVLQQSVELPKTAQLVLLLLHVLLSSGFMINCVLHSGRVTLDHKGMMRVHCAIQESSVV